jgi:hypothetical protein
MVLSTGPSNQDPCSLLNTAYPALYLTTSTSTSQAYPLIASGGVPVSLRSVITSATFNGSQNVLQSPNASSSDRMINYLSTGPTMATVLLYKSGSYDTIVDTFITPKYGGSYTYTTATTALPDSVFYTAGDFDPNGNPTSNPRSIVGSLVVAGYLLKRNEIYDLKLNDPATLVSLYQTEQSSSLTTDQATRKAMLETKNLRFFAAFLIEYCFYRTRYMWLLRQYFNIYSTSTRTYRSPSAGDPCFSLFVGQGNGENKYSGGSLSQPDYLKGIAYHMACINTRLIDMKRVLNGISMYYDSVYLNLESVLNSADEIGSNQHLTQTIQALKTSADTSLDYATQTDFREGVMQYTAEKNRYSNILLGLYAFLNISALAVVFQLLKK